ncbi:uncharacterized protein BO87DRAFT_427837 [Aspergillus neoniger CBS 115656]|uniref:Uncharacterized protein n=1 Tax=Aspergillus neoniger (strain CBS 115656) TaxID=1448310 RepID=A0A318YDE6_ASPNB|nr:hypothetical protein BO87DRAFT_427837 [Aspergillus neoniger CBS 115656]PYH32455.1 hypothetical protein BO87DRAFT_427837 [Aspergillus neoniger CBS 115656]
MSSKCYTTNTSSTIMAMVMIRGASKTEPSAHRSSLKRPFSDWQEYSTVERISADSHGWLSGAIRAMSANRPTRRRDHRQAGGFQREETIREHENIRKVECSPANGSIVPTYPFEMDDQVNRTWDEKLGSQG